MAFDVTWLVIVAVCLSWHEGGLLVGLHIARGLGAGTPCPAGARRDGFALSVRVVQGGGREGFTGAL